MSPVNVPVPELMFFFVLLLSLSTKGIKQPGAAVLTWPSGEQSERAPAALWICCDAVIHGRRYVPPQLSKAWGSQLISLMDFLFRLYLVAVSHFYSFPMVFFSWLSQSDRQLTINPCVIWFSLMVLFNNQLKKVSPIQHR